MSGNDLQLQLEQHANNLEKKLRKANRQLKRTERQLKSAEAAAQSFSEQLDTDKQLKAINELWQRLQDSQAARVAAEQQAEQQMQDVHAASMRAEMREQGEADRAELADAVSKPDEAVQYQGAAAQTVCIGTVALKAELLELQQQLAADSAQRSDLQRNLQRAEQQSANAADMLERCAATQQQLAVVTAERHKLQCQKQAWAKQCEEMRTAADAQAEEVLILKNRNLAVVNVVDKVHAEMATQVQQAAGLQVQLEESQAEMAELRRSSAAQLSHLQSELVNFKKIGAVHSVASSKEGACNPVECTTKAGISAKMQSANQASVGCETMVTTRSTAAAAASKNHMVSKAKKGKSIDKAVGSAQHVQAVGKSATYKTSISRAAATGSKAAAQGRVGAAKGKKGNIITQEKTQPSSGQAEAAPGPTPATAGAAVRPMGSSLPTADTAGSDAGCQKKKGQPQSARTKHVQVEGHAHEQAEPMKTAEGGLDCTGAGTKRKRGTSTVTVKDSRQRRRL